MGYSSSWPPWTGHGCCPGYVATQTGSKKTEPLLWGIHHPGHPGLAVAAAPGMGQPKLEARRQNLYCGVFIILATLDWPWLLPRVWGNPNWKQEDRTFTVGYSSSWPPWTGRGCCPGYVATQTGSKKTEPLLWGIHHPGHPGLAMAAAPSVWQPKLETNARTHTEPLLWGIHHPALAVAAAPGMWQPKREARRQNLYCGVFIILATLDWPWLLPQVWGNPNCKQKHRTFTVGYSSSWPPWTGRGCCPGYGATQTGSKKTEPSLWGIHHPGHPGLAVAAAPSMWQPKLEARRQNLYCGVFIILATLDWLWLLPRVCGNPNWKQEDRTFSVGYSSSWPPWTGRGCCPACGATQTGNICKNTHRTFTVGYSSSWPPWTGRGCCPGYVATQTGSKKTEPLLWGIHHPGHPGLAVAAAPGMWQPKLEARRQNLYCGVFIILATLDWPWLLP